METLPGNLFSFLEQAQIGPRRHVGRGSTFQCNGARYSAPICRRPNIGTPLQEERDGGSMAVACCRLERRPSTLAPMFHVGAFVEKISNHVHVARVGRNVERRPAQVACLEVGAGVSVRFL